MELKVWVEGIQRIVCGVNEKTTCQDVVFALAHATGKTGRFTLIERWRNSERLLAPNEQPLKVLLKWGEHSNDVQFILQWSPLESSSSSNKSGQLQSGKPQVLGGVESSCSDSSSHSPSPLSKPNQPFTGSPNTTSSGGVGGRALSPLSQINGPVPKKPNSGSSSSYTSNDSRLWSPFSQNGPADASPNSQMVPPDLHHNGMSLGSGSGAIRPIHRYPTTEHLFHNSHYKGNENSMLQQSQSSSGKLTDAKQLCSPPPYREPPSPASSSSLLPSTASSSGLHSPGMKNLPPYREPPPPNITSSSNMSSNINKASSSNISGNVAAASVILPRNSAPVFSHGNVNNVLTHSNTNGNLNGSVNNFSSNDKDLIPHHSGGGGSGSHFSPQHDSLSSISSGVEMDSWKSKGKRNGDSSCDQNGAIPKASQMSTSSRPSNSQTNQKELIRILNTQREKLTSQQAELTGYDAEIMFWEGKSREQKRHLENISKEYARLEVISTQQQTQMLSLAHLDEEMENATGESEVLKVAFKKLKVDLDKTEEDLTGCKEKLRIFSEEIALVNDEMQQRDNELLEREKVNLAQLESLRSEIEATKREAGVTEEISLELDEEICQLESVILEKKKQMETLVASMKEANLQSLSVQPPEDLIEVHHRSGSTRRIVGSPRQLENAAPTSKNPHGVWV